MVSLKLRMYLLIGLLFAIVYAVVTMVGYSMGMTNFYVYLAVSFVFMFVQYLVGPMMVEWSMKVRYIKEGEYPQLHRMVRDLAMRANIPVPRIGVSLLPIPNAFAFGRTLRDGRVCVTEGILKLLNEDELKAVLGHEISHLKNKDVVTIMILSVVPMILYRIAWQFMYYGPSRSRDRSSNGALIGLAALIFYFITNLLVLYASRIREYFADKGSVDLGNRPASLASALYKLVYGSAVMPQEAIRTAEGMKAFFANDPSRAVSEFKDLRALDADKSGTISSEELSILQSKKVSIGFGDKMFEIFSTHPNMLKRIKRLSEWKN